MFTGLIEEIGVVDNIKKEVEGAYITIKAQKILEDIKLGDSIATNGVCLTVVDFSKRDFTAYVMPETMDKSNLSLIKNNDVVNLERSLKLGDRIGGHLVSGHVDAMGQIIHIKKEFNSTIYEIKIHESLDKYIIKKGSICIDGISLTIVDIKKGQFSVWIIPHTQRETILHNKKVGDKVNIECDFFGKYVHRNLNKEEKPIDKNFLISNGFC